MKYAWLVLEVASSSEMRTKLKEAEAADAEIFTIVPAHSGWFVITRIPLEPTPPEVRAPGRNKTR